MLVRVSSSEPEADRRDPFTGWRGDPWLREDRVESTHQHAGDERGKLPRGSPAPTAPHIRRPPGSPSWNVESSHGLRDFIGARFTKAPEAPPGADVEKRMSHSMAREHEGSRRAHTSRRFGDGWTPCPRPARSRPVTRSPRSSSGGPMRSSGSAGGTVGLGLPGT